MLEVLFLGVEESDEDRRRIIEEGKDRERMEEKPDETRKEEDSEKGEDRKAEEEEKGRSEGRSEKDGMTVFILINFNNPHALLETVPHIIRKQSKL